jgi:DNA-binding HxlR family transcriptional regulator
MTTTANIPVNTTNTTTTPATKNTVAQIINPSDNIKMKSCPIENTFKIIGKKFTVLILRNMMNGKQNRFNQLLNSIEEGNPKTLTIRLRNGKIRINKT